MHLLITQQSTKKLANLVPAAVQVAKGHHASVLSLVLPYPRFGRICIQQSWYNLNLIALA